MLNRITNLRQNRYYSEEAEAVLSDFLRTADGDLEVVRALNGFLHGMKLWPELRERHLKELFQIINCHFIPEFRSFRDPANNEKAAESQ
jgi:hypothetical protein